MSEVQFVPSHHNANFQSKRERKAELPKPKGRHALATLKKFGPTIAVLDTVSQTTSKLPTSQQIASTNTLCINNRGIVSTKPSDRKNARTLILGAYAFNGMAQIEFTGADPDDMTAGLIIRALKTQGIEANFVFEGNGTNKKVMTVQPTGKVTIVAKPETTTIFA